MTPLWEVLDKLPVELIKIDSITAKCIVKDTDTLYYLLRAFQHSGRRWIVQISDGSYNKMTFSAYPHPHDKLDDKDLAVEIMYKTCLIKSCV